MGDLCLFLFNDPVPSRSNGGSVLLKSSLLRNFVLVVVNAEKLTFFYERFAPDFQNKTSDSADQYIFFVQSLHAAQYRSGGWWLGICYMICVA